MSYSIKTRPQLRNERKSCEHLKGNILNLIFMKIFQNSSNNDAWVNFMVKQSHNVGTLGAGIFEQS